MRNLLIAAASLLVVPLALAQEAQPREGAGPQRQAAEELLRVARQNRQIITIDFPGGTLRQYIQALRAASEPNPINVVASSSAMQTPVGEINLEKVDAKTAVSALRWAVEPFGSVSVDEMESSFGVAVGMPSRAKVRAPETEVLSMRDLTTPMPGDPLGQSLTVGPDVVLTAARTAMMSDNGDAPDLKYHADSGLLIIRGGEGQINAAKSVLDRMRSDLMNRRAAAREADRPQDRQLKIEVEVLAQKEQFVRDQLSRLAVEMDNSNSEAAAAAERGSQVEQQRARASAEYTAHSLQKAKQQLQEIGQQLVEARARLDATHGGQVEVASSPTLAIYDMRDVGAETTDLTLRFMARVLESAKTQPPQIVKGSLIVTATPEIHAALQSMLRAMRSPGEPGAAEERTPAKTRPNDGTPR